MSDGKNHAIVCANFCDLEAAFFEHAKIQPPCEVAVGVEVIQPPDLKARRREFAAQLRARVAAEVTEIFVYRRIKLRARRDEEADRGTARRERARIFGPLARVVADEFEDVHAEDSVELQSCRQVDRRALDEFVAGVAFAMLQAALRVWPDGDDALDFLQLAQVHCHLPDASADLHKVAAQPRAELADECLAVVAGLVERGKPEVAGAGDGIGGGGHRLLEEVSLTPNSLRSPPPGGAQVERN